MADEKQQPDLTAFSAQLAPLLSSFTVSLSNALTSIKLPDVNHQGEQHDTKGGGADNNITSSFDFFTSALQDATQALDAFHSALQGASAPKQEKEPKKESGDGGAIATLQGATTAATGALSGMTSSISSAGGGVQALGGAIGGASQMLSGVLGPAGAAAGQALGQVVSQVGQFINAVQPFVEALNPGTILLFNQALENLQAAVGTAFEPIFQVLTDTFNKVNALILPMMEQLRPVIEQVSQSFAGALLPIVQAAVSSFQSFLPFLKMVADIVGVWAIELKALVAIFRLASLIFEPFRIALALILDPFVKAFQIFGAVLDGISEVINAVSTVFEVLMQTIRGMFGGLDVKDVMKSLADATNKVIAAFYRMIGQVAKFFGMDTFLKNLITSLEPKSGQVAAPKNAAISSVDSVAKEMAVAAATASGTAQDDKEKTMADVVAELKAQAAGGDSKFTQLFNVVKSIATALNAKVGAETAQALGYDNRSEALADVFGGATGAVRMFDRFTTRNSRRRTTE